MEEGAPNKRTFKFKAPEGVVGKYSFTLSQRDPRLWAEGVKPTAYSKMAIWSYDEGDDALAGFTFVDAICTREKHTFNMTVQVEVDGSGKSYCIMYDQNWVDDTYWLNLTCHGPEEIVLEDVGVDFTKAWWNCCNQYALSGDYLITGYDTIKVQCENSIQYKIHKFDTYFGFECYFL